VESLLEPELEPEVEEDVFSLEPPEEDDMFSLELPVALADGPVLPLPPPDEDEDPPVSPSASSSLACRSTAAGNSVAPDVSVLLVFVPAED